jgi:hypothetical protein
MFGTRLVVELVSGDIAFDTRISEIHEVERQGKFCVEKGCDAKMYRFRSLACFVDGWATHAGSNRS